MQTITGAINHLNFFSSSTVSVPTPFERKLQQWEQTAGNGADSAVAANRIRDASQSNSPYLDFSGLDITSSPPIPDFVTRLDFSGCHSLTSGGFLDDLPRTVQRINFRGCISLREIPANLPLKLTHLYLDGCINLNRELPPSKGYFDAGRQHAGGLAAVTDYFDPPRYLPDTLEVLSIVGINGMHYRTEALPFASAILMLPDDLV